MKLRLCIAGGSGLLAVNWALRMRDKYEVFLLFNQRIIHLDNVKGQVVQLTSEDEVLRIISAIQPDIVVNAAALTNIEQCEEEPDLAEQVNVGIAKNLAAACGATGSQMVHVSTDQLFDGIEPFMPETAPAQPLNIYGATKQKAENVVMAHLEHGLVVRTNFFGWGPSYRRSFSDWIIDNVQAGKNIPLFNDAFFTPIYVGELIDVTHALLDARASGVFNVVGDARLSKHDFAMRLCRAFDLDTELIQSASLANQGFAATRPPDMSLSNAKLHSCVAGLHLEIDDMLAGLLSDSHIKTQMKLI